MALDTTPDHRTHAASELAKLLSICRLWHEQLNPNVAVDDPRQPAQMAQIHWGEDAAYLRTLQGDVEERGGGMYLCQQEIKQ